jgi:hypothetical protein
MTPTLQWVLIQIFQARRAALGSPGVVFVATSSGAAA